MAASVSFLSPLLHILALAFVLAPLALARPIMVQGPASANMPNGTSTATCPPGYTLIDCKCAAAPLSPNDTSTGVHYDHCFGVEYAFSDGVWSCTAYQGYLLGSLGQSSPVVARIVCDDTAESTLPPVRSPWNTVVNQSVTTVSCPAGTELITCACLSYNDACWKYSSPTLFVTALHQHPDHCSITAVTNASATWQLLAVCGKQANLAQSALERVGPLAASDSSQVSCPPNTTLTSCQCVYAPDRTTPIACSARRYGVNNSDPNTCRVTFGFLIVNSSTFIYNYSGSALAICEPGVEQTVIVSAAMRVSEAQRGLLNCPPGYRALDCLCAPQPDGECHYLWGSVRYSTSCYSYFLQNPNNTILATALCRPGPNANRFYVNGDAIVHVGSASTAYCPSDAALVACGTLSTDSREAEQFFHIRGTALGFDAASSRYYCTATQHEVDGKAWGMYARAYCDRNGAVSTVLRETAVARNSHVVLTCPAGSRVLECTCASDQPVCPYFVPGSHQIPPLIQRTLTSCALNGSAVTDATAEWTLTVICGSTGDYHESPTVRLGDVSSAQAFAESFVSCPRGQTMISCTCVDPETHQAAPCKGVRYWVDTEGVAWCAAQSRLSAKDTRIAFFGPIVAKAHCTTPASPVLNLTSVSLTVPSPGADANATLSCPAEQTLLSCGCLTDVADDCFERGAMLALNYRSCDLTVTRDLSDATLLLTAVCGTPQVSTAPATIAGDAALEPVTLLFIPSTYYNVTGRLDLATSSSLFLTSRSYVYVGGDITFHPTSILVLDNDASAPNSAPQIEAKGCVTLGGTLHVANVDPQQQKVVQVLSFGCRVGEFTSVRVDGCDEDECCVAQVEATQDALMITLSRRTDGACLSHAALLRGITGISWLGFVAALILSWLS